MVGLACRARFSPEHGRYFVPSCDPSKLWVQITITYHKQWCVQDVLAGPPIPGMDAHLPSDSCGIRLKVHPSGPQELLNFKTDEGYMGYDRAAVQGFGQRI